MERPTPIGLPIPEQNRLIKQFPYSRTKLPIESYSHLDKSYVYDKIILTDIEPEDIPCLELSEIKNLVKNTAALQGLYHIQDLYNTALTNNKIYPQLIPNTQRLLTVINDRIKDLQCSQRTSVNPPVELGTPRGKIDSLSIQRKADKRPTQHLNTPNNERPFTSEPHLPGTTKKDMFNIRPKNPSTKPE